jgi:integrase
MVNLTDLSIRSLSPPQKGQKDYFDTVVPGFGVRVSQGGTRSFFLFVGKKNSRERKSIGRWGIITLAQARAEAKRLLAERTLGHRQLKTITFSAALLQFEEQWYPHLKPRTIKDYKRIFKDHFSKKLGDYRLADIEFETITAITDKLVKTPTEQKHALVVCNTFFRWCVRRRLLKHSSLDGVDIPKPPSRKRVLSDEELTKVYRALVDCPDPFRSIVRLLILSGQRRGEITALRPAWFKHNEQAIVLPPEITKNKREHVVPLGPMALAVLADLPKEAALYFPCSRHNGNMFSGFSKAKKLLDKLLPGLAPWTLHDLRRTFSTNLAKLGVLPHIKEMLLNHVAAKSDVEAIYDTYKYLPEMRAAMEKWENHFSTLLKNCARAEGIRRDAAQLEVTSVDRMAA